MDCLLDLLPNAGETTVVDRDRNRVAPPPDLPGQLGHAYVVLREPDPHSAAKFFLCSWRHWILTQSTVVDRELACQHPLAKKVSNVAGEISKQIRDRMKWSQALLAERLQISRNYVALIESGAKKPSVRLLNQLEQLLTHVDEVGNPQPKGTVRLNEAQHPYGDDTVARLVAELDAEYKGLRDLAGHDAGRLGWLREELRGLRARARWRSEPEWRQAEADVAELTRRAEDAETAAQQPHQKERRHA